MDTQRTAQIVAWTLVGIVTGALISAFGLITLRGPSLAGVPEPSPLLGYVLVFGLFAGFGIPPGLAGGFLMGCLAAPLPTLGSRISLSMLIGALVGWIYSWALCPLFAGHPPVQAFLVQFGICGGAVAGVLVPLGIEAIRHAFDR